MPPIRAHWSGSMGTPQTESNARGSELHEAARKARKANERQDKAKPKPSQVFSTYPAVDGKEPIVSPKSMHDLTFDAEGEEIMDRMDSKYWPAPCGPHVFYDLRSPIIHFKFLPDISRFLDWKLGGHVELVKLNIRKNQKKNLTKCAACKQDIRDKNELVYKVPCCGSIMTHTCLQANLMSLRQCPVCERTLVFISYRDARQGTIAFIVNFYLNACWKLHNLTVQDVLEMRWDNTVPIEINYRIISLLNDPFFHRVRRTLKRPCRKPIARIIDEEIKARIQDLDTLRIRPYDLAADLYKSCFEAVQEELQTPKFQRLSERKIKKLLGQEEGFQMWLRIKIRVLISFLRLFVLVDGVRRDIEEVYEGLEVPSPLLDMPDMGLGAVWGDEESSVDSMEEEEEEVRSPRLGTPELEL